MIIYGSSQQGYYAQGILSGSNLLIEQVCPYENNLDLFIAITGSNSPWGLDFPFSIPFQIYKLWGLSNWPELLNLALLTSKNDFLKLCKQIDLKENLHQLARFTDLTNQAKHVLQKYNLKLQNDFFDNLRLLAYLKQSGALVCPFDELEKQKASPHLYEIRHETLWLKTGLRKNKNLKQFVEKFNELDILKLQIPDYFLNISSLACSEAILACVVLAIQIKNFNLEQNWQIKPLNITEDEWALRSLEGLIFQA